VKELRGELLSAGRCKGRGGLDSELLFGAAWSGSPSANNLGAEAISEGQAHLRVRRSKDEENSSP
jgi:hypothetical protein